MKHFLYILVCALPILSIGCNKISNDENEVQNESPVTPTIIGIIDDETKTSYDSNGKFSWVSGDKISVQLCNKEEPPTSWNKWTLSANSSSRESTFSASDTGYTSSWNLANYACYPKDYYGFTVTMSNAEVPTFSLPSSTNDWQLYNAGKDPLSIVPLIGEKVSQDGNVITYTFNAACGVLKINFENTPSLNSLRLILHHDDYPLCGEFTLSGENTLLEENATGSRNTTRTINPHEYGFTSAYVALPIGTIPAGLSIKLMRESTGVVYTEVVTNTTIGTVKSRISRARGRLQEDLKEYI